MSRSGFEICWVWTYLHSPSVLVLNSRKSNTSKHFDSLHLVSSACPYFSFSLSKSIPCGGKKPLNWVNSNLIQSSCQHGGRICTFSLISKLRFSLWHTNTCIHKHTNKQYHSLLKSLKTPSLPLYTFLQTNHHWQHFFSNNAPIMDKQKNNITRASYFFMFRRL